MQRDVLLISEMIDAAEQTRSLVADTDDLVALGDDVTLCCGTSPCSRGGRTGQ